MTSHSSSTDWFSTSLNAWLAWFDALAMPFRLALMFGGFILFWPIGLAILGYLMWSGQLACSNRQNHRSEYRGWGGYGPRRGRWQSSGNRAFDEYRDATLKQLEEDQREFANFLDQLRRAKDQKQFDDFMAERMQRAQAENGREPRPDEGGSAA